MRRTPFILILLLIITGTACEEDGTCTDNVISRVKAGFYVRDSNGERDTTLGPVTFFGVLRPDSLLYNASSARQSIVFPLSDGSEEFTRFVFTAGTQTDTIKIWHQSRLQLVSYACGFTTVHELYWIGHERNIIDTVSISEPLVDLNDAENIKVYIRPVVADSAQ